MLAYGSAKGGCCRRHRKRFSTFASHHWLQFMAAALVDSRHCSACATACSRGTRFQPLPEQSQDIFRVMVSSRKLLQLRLTPLRDSAFSKVVEIVVDRARVLKPRRQWAVVLLVSLFSTNLYRAATQSFVGDEAYMWAHYLATPTREIFQTFDVNNHFLQTVLAKVAQVLLGNSEFALRLPTVLAGGFFFWTVYRLVFFIFGETWRAMVSLGVLVLNPLLLDFFVTCRGYGVALALLAAGLAELVYFFTAEEWELRRMQRAAFTVALSVTANLTFAVPAMACSIVLTVLLFINPSPKVGRWSVLTSFAIPAAITAMAFLAISPIAKAKPDQFYVGARSAVQTVTNLVDASVNHSSPNWVYWRNPTTGDILTKVVAFSLVPLTLILCASGSIRALIRLRSSGLCRLTSEEVLLLWSGGTLLLSTAILVVLRNSVGLLYPVDRTGLYLIFLTALASTAVPAGFDRIFAKISWTAVPMFFAVLFLTQLETKYFAVWRYDADARDLLQHARSTDRPAELGITWELEPSINYY